MELRLSREGKALIASVQGRLTLGPKLKTLSAKLLPEIARTETELLVLDLSGVPSVDSAGAGELMQVYFHVGEHRKRMALAGVQPLVKRTLVIIAVDPVLPQFADVEAAIREG